MRKYSIPRRATPMHPGDKIMNLTVLGVFGAVSLFWVARLIFQVAASMVTGHIQF